jgi:hypothetical protein
MPAFLPRAVGALTESSANGKEPPIFPHEDSTMRYLAAIVGTLGTIVLLAPIH